MHLRQPFFPFQQTDGCVRYATLVSSPPSTPLHPIEYGPLTKKLNAKKGDPQKLGVAENVESHSIGTSQIIRMQGWGKGGWWGNFIDVTVTIKRLRVTSFSENYFHNKQKSIDGIF